MVFLQDLSEFVDHGHVLHAVLVDDLDGYFNSLRGLVKGHGSVVTIWSHLSGFSSLLRTACRFWRVGLVLFDRDDVEKSGPEGLGVAVGVHHDSHDGTG